MAYLKGTLNLADSMTKFTLNPIEIINSDNYRMGPPIIRQKDFANHINIFLEIKGKEFKYTPVLRREEDILTLQKEIDIIFQDNSDTEQINFTQKVTSC